MARKKLSLFGLFLFSAILLVACGAKDDALGKDDAGREITLVVGEKIQVTLDANPTTGYQWDIAEIDESVLKSVGDSYDADSPQLVGSGGQEIFTFEAVAVGKTALQMLYHQPWDEDTPPAETFSLRVVVK